MANFIVRVPKFKQKPLDYVFDYRYFNFNGELYQKLPRSEADVQNNIIHARGMTGELHKFNRTAAVVEMKSVFNRELNRLEFSALEFDRGEDGIGDLRPVKLREISVGSWIVTTRNRTEYPDHFEYPIYSVTTFPKRDPNCITIYNLGTGTSFGIPLDTLVYRVNLYKAVNFGDMELCS